MRRHVILTGCFLLITSFVFGQSNPWTSFSENDIPVKGDKRINPEEYHTFQLSQSVLQTQLATAKEAGEISLRNSPFRIQLPQPDGRLQNYLLAYAPVMAPALAAKFPEITTYVVQGIDDPHARGRLDWTPAGFHGMIMSPSGTVYIDPLQTEDDRHYQVYFKKDFVAENQGVIPACQPEDYDETLKKEMEGLLLKKASSHVQAAPSGSNLRTYRLAVAATGEYTQFHGGTVAGGQAAIVTAINRVTGIYEVEIACRLELVANNDMLVYTNGSTDPYSNNNGGALLGENQSNCDAVIGSANYDIGHVFNTGGGGLASLGVVCNNGSKARGQTGLSSPVGDPFYVDYVAHEIGHQFAGNHTFNGSSGSCSGGNRNGSTAYEPGSGTTIQAYAGICGSQNTASNSDDYFHTISFDEMVTFTTQSNGNNCPNTTATGNSIPVPTAGGGGLTIPINTPFALTGSATDADGDPLTYNWEQFNLGSAGSPNSPSGNAPIFRSFPASTSPTRTFPQTSDLLNNTQTIGEILPSYGRNLTFRMTARDNRADGGGVDYTQISLTVDGGSGPFLVTTPNTNVSWTGLSTETVTWDVANTDIGPVNCTNVDILLSTDGGISFPTVILSGVANDGSQDIIVPNMPTSEARIRVACSNNVFFDLSNQDFTILLGAVIPVELVEFQARAAGKAIQLNWTTAVEIDNRGFEIERSTTPDRGFEKVAWLAAQDFRGANNAYYLMDEDVNAGQFYYYRLRQVDYSGDATYSDVVSAKVKGSTAWDLQLQPNPAKGQVSIVNAADVGENISLQIFRVDGQVVYSTETALQKAGDQELIDLSTFAPGVYILKGKADGQEIVKRLIVR